MHPLFPPLFTLIAPSLPSPRAYLHLSPSLHAPSSAYQPLPGKQVARYFDHMSETFLEERQRALDKFLRRLIAHPYFSFSHDLKIFLTASSEVRGWAGSKCLNQLLVQPPISLYFSSVCSWACPVSTVMLNLWYSVILCRLDVVQF